MFPRFYHARSVIRSFSFSVSKKESKHFRSRAGKRRERDSPWDRLALMQIRRERERVLEGTPEHPIISSACSLIIASLTPTSGDPSNWFSSSPRFLQLFPLSLSVWLLTHEIAAKSLGQLFPGSIKIPMTIVRTARIYELADPRLLIVHPTVNSGVEVHRLACVYHCVCIHIHARSLSLFNCPWKCKHKYFSPFLLLLLPTSLLLLLLLLLLATREAFYY